MSLSVIKLNVGGNLFTTSKLTLKRYPDSFLAKLCDGEENGLASLKDENGFIFIDRNGEFFKYILDFLRDNVLNLNDKDLIRNLRNEANFFLLLELVELCDKKLSIYDEFKTVDLKVGSVKYKVSLNLLTKRSLYFKNFFDESLINLEILKDKDGFIFIDREGEYFKYILEFLRNNDIKTQDRVILKIIRNEANFFCLPKLIALCDEKLKIINDFTLIKLKVGNKLFSETISLLTKESLYFKKIFDGNLIDLKLLENGNGYISIKRSEILFEDVLKFFKFGKIYNIDKNNYYNYLEEADFFQIMSLKTYIEQTVQECFI